MKKLLSLLLIICICFCVVGCNKVTDVNSSDSSSIITEIETETIYIDEQEGSSNDTTTEESKIETTSSNTPSENTTPASSTITSSATTPSQESTLSTTTPSQETDSPENNTLPDWAREPQASQIIDWVGSDLVGHSLLVITTNNELYHLSTNKLFSNGTHFKKIESEYKFEKFFSGGSYDTKVITIDNKLLQVNCTYGDYVNITGVTGFEEVIIYEKPNIIGDYKENFILYGYDSQNYVHYENNNILSFENEIIYSFPQGENILFADDTTVQTTKGFYVLSAKKEQEFVDSIPKVVVTAEFVGTQAGDVFLKWYLNWGNN